MFVKREDTKIGDVIGYTKGCYKSIYLGIVIGYTPKMLKVACLYSPTSFFSKSNVNEYIHVNTSKLEKSVLDKINKYKKDNNI